MAKQISNYGRYQVIESTLTDRSTVYDVQFPADTGESITISCMSLDGAEVMASTLAAKAIDVSVTRARVVA